MKLSRILTEPLYKNQVRPNDHRGPYERDRARIVHSAAFRRLQAKTQILGIGEGDYHRSRLTHSLEVAQIGQSISSNLRYRYQKQRTNWRLLLPEQYLIEAICLAHDLGHPPFGHAGEAALNYCMQDSGGFEGNGQTLRILTTLEAYHKPHGLNLTRRTLLGVLKYPAPWDSFPLVSELFKGEGILDLDNRPILSKYTPPKCYLPTEKKHVQKLLEVFDEQDRSMIGEITPRQGKYGKTTYKTFDSSIMELADDIAYGVHDLEDAISLGYISQEELESALKPISKSFNRLDGIKFKSTINNLYNRNGRKRAIGGIVNAMIVSIEVRTVPQFRHPLLHWNAFLSEDAKAVLEICKRIVRRKVIDMAQVQQLDWRGQHIIKSLFVALHADAEILLKDNFREEWKIAQTEESRKRVICDYIAGMTDEYANRLYERLFIPRIGRVSDQL